MSSHLTSCAYRAIFNIKYGEAREMVEEQEVREKHDEAQAIEGYGCTCGFRTVNKREFQNHVMFGSAQDGKGTHKSLGHINLQTGEVVLPPWKQRTKAQRERSVRKARTAGMGAGTGNSTVAPPIKTTDILTDAQELRFTPRVFTTDYTPIMRMARDVVINKWGWRPDMPLQNMLDTIIYHFFEDRGYTLAGYIVSEEAQKELEEREIQKAQEVE